MVNIIKEEIEIEESLESRLRVICDFCNTTPTIINGFLNVDYIKFRESVANVSNELYFNGYYDRYIPSIFGNIYGQIRFSEYLPEKEVGEQIMRLRQFYDVGYYEATVVYSKKPIMVDAKPVPYYEEEEENFEAPKWFTQKFDFDLNKYSYYGNIIDNSFNKWIDENF